MKKLSKILVATDFSPSADSAVAHAVAIAARTGAELHVLHVYAIHANMYGWAATANVAAIETAMAEQSRQELEQTIRNIPGPTVHGVVRELKEAPAIVRYAKTHDIDLIVMGTHARKGISHVFLGSVAAAVLRHAPGSVMVIGPEHTPPKDSYRQLLAPVDFSASADAAMQQAAAIANQHDADLIAMHVVETRAPTPYDRTFESPAEIRDRADKALEERLAQLELPRGPEQRHVITGSAYDEIVSFAREKSVDLIVMGSVGASSRGRLLLGSTTERVARNASCAVLAHRGAIVDKL